MAANWKYDCWSMFTLKYIHMRTVLWTFPAQNSCDIDKMLDSVSLNYIRNHTSAAVKQI